MFGAKRVGGLVKITVPVEDDMHVFYVSGDSMALDMQLKSIGIENWGIEPSGELSLTEPVWLMSQLRMYLAETYFKGTPLADRLRKDQ